MENAASLQLLQALKFKDENNGPFVGDQKGHVKRFLEEGGGRAARSHSATGLSHGKGGQCVL